MAAEAQPSQRAISHPTPTPAEFRARRLHGGTRWSGWCARSVAHVPSPVTGDVQGLDDGPALASPTPSRAVKHQSAGRLSAPYPCEGPANIATV